MPHTQDAPFRSVFADDDEYRRLTSDKVLDYGELGGTEVPLQGQHLHDTEQPLHVNEQQDVPAPHLQVAQSVRRGAALDETENLMSGTKTIPLHRLGARTPCAYCRALLFAHEKRWGQMCCMKGQVLLDPIIEHLEVDVSASAQMQHRALCLKNIVDTWKATTEVGQVLRKYARQLSNAIAMASTTAASEVVHLMERGHLQLSFAARCTHVWGLCGTMHHRVREKLGSCGITTQREHDNEDTTIDARLGHMRLPAHVTAHERNCLRVILHQFQAWLHACLCSRLPNGV